MFDKTCKNLLVRGVNWIGDAVMTMPALRALRKELPDTKISLLVKPWVAPLFENNPFIDDIILYEDKYNSINGKFRLSSVLKTKSCSSILFQNAFDAALIAFLSGIPQRIGYNRDWRGFLLTNSIPFNNDDRKMHHIEYYLNILRQAGIHADFSLPYIYLSLNERIRARNILKGLKRPVIGINPGASYGSTKRWHPEKFAEVSKRIISGLDGSVVIFGGQSETGIAEEITSESQISNLKSQILTMAGKTDLRELSALISECDVLLTNDSGPMHIGYAVRTPLVAIFGSTNPDLTGPLGSACTVIKKNIDCSPCFKKACDRNKMDCMDAITSDEVFDAIERSIPKNKAVFFDRDGTLCRDAEYLNSFDNLEIFPEVRTLSVLKEKGYKLIGISNQSGIARGIVDEEFTRKVNNIFIEQYGFDDFYYCPHRPDERCPCRKPEPEMILKARAEHGIDLKQSYVIGDKEIDMLIAKSAGAKGILVLTGQGAESVNADYVAKDLDEAVKWILGNP
ncbi:MAG: lipopolysaccharide heptosyltransferase II [Thermodesulfovibrionales bacterium]|nr:lipopolysaccharide heptosyltransferase II [Thermodesulfovibrionales bacterium]